MALIVDPPSGWQYGFPCAYDPDPGESYEAWLRRRAYPEKDIPLALKHSRWWSSTPMDVETLVSQIPEG